MASHVLQQTSIFGSRTQRLTGKSPTSQNSGIELDIMTSLKGLAQIRFECFQISPIADIDNIAVRFLHINQLIAAKKASGRPKDLLDIEELEKIKKGDQLVAFFLNSLSGYMIFNSLIRLVAPPNLSITNNT
jgi:hypothetical protein